MNKILILLLALSCSSIPESDIKNLVFIQGRHLDEDVWDEVIKNIDSKFYRFTRIDRDERDTYAPASLTKIATSTCKDIPKKSILIAHDYGGAIVSQMLGICPEKINKVIYVAAMIPLAGEKPFEQLTKAEVAHYSKAIRATETMVYPKEGREFFNVTDVSVAPTKKLPKLYDEWISLDAETISYEPVVFKQLPKLYIYTEKDKVISTDSQLSYAHKAGVKTLRSLQVGHYPMISNPKGLALLIVDLVNKL